jgi:ABC-2 type transport system permease protein
MNLPRVLAITGRIITQFRHDHRSVALVFIVPIFVMSILGYVFRAQESSTVSVALVNEDRPAAGQARLSDTIINDLKSNDNLEITEMTKSNAEKAVRDGKERVALVFPAGFTQGLRENHKASIEVIVEGSNPSEASGALAVVGQAVQRSSTAVLKSLVPPQAASLVPQGPPVEVATTRLYGSPDLKVLDFFAPMFIAYIGFFLIFLLTSVSFLRERTQGTMERLAASPVTRLELVLGYMFGFGFFSMVQAAVLVLFTVYVLQVKYAGNLLSVFVVTLALVLGAVNLGILLSAFSKNELQAIQFIPLVILPQVFLSGLLWPIQEMPPWLQAFARLMPLSYAVDALTSIMVRGQALSSTWLDLAVLLGFASLIAVLGAVSVRREVA